MPDFRVDSIYDINALQTEQDKFLSFLADSKAAILDLNSQRITVKTADVSTFTQASDQMNKTIDQSTQVTAKAVAATKQLTLAQAEARQASLEHNAALKSQVISNKASTGSYIQLQEQLKKLVLEYKNMGAAERNSVTGQALQKGILDRTTQLKTLDAGLGTYSRNIGNYASAFYGYANTLRGVRGPVKLLGEAIGVGAQEADQFRLILEHSFQAISAFFRGKEAKAAEAAEAALKTQAETAAQIESTVATEAATVAETELNVVRKANIKESAGILIEENALNETRAESVVANTTLLTVEEQLSAVRASVLETVDAQIASEIALSDAKYNEVVATKVNTTSQEENIIVTKAATVAQEGLTVATETTSTAMKVFQTVMKFSGIGLVLAAIGLVIYAFSKWREEMKLEEHTIKLFNETLKATSEIYAKAITDVNRLKEEISLAKEGFLDKKKVVEDYNESIGKTTGLVKTLDEAEKALNRNAEAYIKFTYLKAVANEANAQSAKKAVEAALDQQKGVEEFATTGGAFLSTVKALFTTGNSLASASLDLSKKAETAKKKAITNETSDSNALLLIAKKYGDEAAALAKQFNFNPFQDNKEDTKKSLADQSGLLSEYLKKDQEQLGLFSKQELERSRDLYASLYADQNNSEIDRLESLKNFYLASSKLIALDEKAKEDALKVQVGIDLKKAAEIKNEKLRLKTITIINKTTQDTLANITADGQKAQTDLDLKFSKDSIKIIDEGFIKEEKLAEDHAKTMREIQQKRLDSAISSVQQNVDSTSTDLIGQVQTKQAGKNATARANIEEKLQKDLTEIAKEGELDRLAIQETDLEEQRNLLLLYGENTDAVDAAITENKRKQAELRKGIIDDEVNYEIAKRNKLLDAVLVGENQLLEITQAIGDGKFQKQKDEAQKQSNLIDEQTQKKIDAVNAEVISDQDKAAKIAIINARAAAEKQALDLKQRKADHDKAKFDKEIAILQIIAQIAIDIAEAKFGAAALAGAALIKLIATPIPAYKHGRGEGKEELAIVGDGGVNEYIMRGTGVIEKTPSVNTLTHLMPKDKVYKNKEALMRELMLNNMQLSDYSVSKDGGINKNDIERMTNRIEQAVNNIKVPPSTQITKEGWRMVNERNARYDQWVQRTIKN